MADTGEITVLSLCTGYGGLEIGLSWALERPLWVVAVEIEAFALANLVAKAEAGELAIEALWPDLRTFPAEKFRGCFDFVLAGYPCQPFSTAGKRKGAADPRHLWPDIAGIVQAVGPVWCFFENVPGHLGLGFAEVYRSLRDMGYSVEAGLFTAAECGMGFLGERLFILAKAMPSRLETHRLRQGSQRIPAKWASSQNNCFDAIKRFWETASRTYRGRYGAAYRVDRLRLLGNGVVPVQAEKAFRCLIKNFGQSNG